MIVDERPGLLFPEAGAIFDDDRRYRYRLWRQWAPAGRRCVFVMLNPSTADALVDDPTIIRCTTRARSLGCARLDVVNLFALRSTDPAVLVDPPCDPVGAGNDEIIVETCTPGSWDGDTETPLIVAAWGAHPVARRRDRPVLAAIMEHVYLPVWRIGPPTLAGHPCHPLYLPASAELERHAW